MWVSAHWWPNRYWRGLDINGTMLDVKATFCYLGDMLCSGGDCDSAVAARCCVAWGTLRKLLPVLTTRHLSPKICGKVYKACVCSAMFHGSETWDLRNPNCGGSAAMTMPWSVGSMASKTPSVYVGVCNVLTISNLEINNIMKTHAGIVENYSRVYIIYVYWITNGS